MPTYDPPIITGRAALILGIERSSLDSISSSGTAYGTVTNVSVVTANGISGTVANSTTTPSITLTLGAITPTSVAAVGTITGSNLSGTNTGDQTTITGNAGSATVLQTPRTINGVAFDGSANISVPGSGFRYEQLVASASWAISHGMNKYPSVSIIDSSGASIVGDVSWVDLNNVTINFSGAIAGEAYLN